MLKVKNGTLYFQDYNMVDLAKELGTPLYVYSHQGIVNQINKLKDCFIKPYPKNRIAYAAKAFFPLAMGRIAVNQGICVDVVSGGELYTAIKAGVSPENIEFNGNNKSEAELEMAIDYEIGRIIIDSLQELSLIEDICKAKGKTANILYRITPGIKSDSHDYIVTGKKDSKFGIPLDEDVFYPAMEDGINSKYVNLLGLHFHLGSQLLDNSSYLQALEVMLDLVKQVKVRYNYDFTELNIGGGFGIKYTDETPPEYSYFLTPMMKRIEEFYNEINVELPAIVVEPGRSIVGESGLTLYTVGSIKDIKDIRKYVSVDGGMGDNIRPALYSAKYSCIVANKADKPAEETVTISGKYCESGDILIKDVALPKLEKGDTLAVLSTGAYGYSMASNYNKNPIPGVVMIDNNNYHWIVQPESYEDVINNEEIPTFLSR